MKKFVGERSKKTGLPPGTLVHIGDRRRSDVQINVIKYNETEFDQKFVNCSELEIPKDDLIYWIDISGLHDVEILREIGIKFEISDLVLEDIINTEQRPKIEGYDGYLYIVTKMIYFENKNNDLLIEQVSIVLGKNYVITFQENEQDVFESVRERLKMGVGKIRSDGSGFLTYSLMDAIVDNYFNVLENIGTDIQTIEDLVISDASKHTLNQLNLIKRKMLFIHKSIWPMREVLSTLVRGDFDLVDSTTIVFLRDVYDHVVQAMDTTETYRDILSGIQDIFLSSNGNKMNEIMKILTVFSTIFMPLTFIVGVYGMNFKVMPELDWRYGYLFVWFLIIVIGVSMVVFFKRKKWL